jgi:hypothetical protein
MANHQSKTSDPAVKSSAKPAIVHEVVTQHAEEASFLWLLRHAAVSQPHYSLADLSKLDNRVEAHLDGLRVAGESGWNVVQGEGPVGSNLNLQHNRGLRVESQDSRKYFDIRRGKRRLFPSVLARGCVPTC